MYFLEKKKDLQTLLFFTILSDMLLSSGLDVEWESCWVD